jgi:2'-5' RNA ligase
MAWAPNWWERREAILRHGLPAVVLGARITDGFVAIYFDIDEQLLLRSHAARGFSLHLTLGYTSDYGDGVAEATVERLNRRYAGQWIMLNIEWVGTGGSATLSPKDFLATDEDIRWLHSRGHYGNGRFVEPRQLHISL